ncbi:MAG: transcription elongation factor GreA [Chloroflexi bacterium]|nr:transcription elongation factor GreA [Chloroflexota bacterium]
MGNEPKQYPMTQEAYDRLVAEHTRLTEIDRPALARRLKAAIEMGDLSENAEYISAKEDQGFLVGRINELEEQIKGAYIIQETGSNDKVRLGSRVTVVEDGETDEEVFLLVGQVEANPMQGKISNESPLGMALMGKKKGSKVRINAPDGKLVFKIVRIE